MHNEKLTSIVLAFQAKCSRTTLLSARFLHESKVTGWLLISRILQPLPGSLGDFLPRSFNTDAQKDRFWFLPKPSLSLWRLCAVSPWLSGSFSCSSSWSGSLEDESVVDMCLNANLSAVGDFRLASTLDILLQHARAGSSLQAFNF